MKLTLEDLDTITLSNGNHSGPDNGMCLLEATALFAGESFSDHPVCVDPVLAQFGRSWNDSMRSDAERAQLKQYITRLPGTNKGAELSRKRGWMAMDWLIRVHTVAWIELNPSLVHHAETLKSLPPITCTVDLKAAQPKLDAARKDAAAAWDAASAAAGDASRAAAWDAVGAAAWDAAGDASRAAVGAAAGDASRAAAWAAAWDASRAAAGDAAWDAAGDAAGAAAWDAAGDAVEKKLEPTVLMLQESAHELFSSMISAE